MIYLILILVSQKSWSQSCITENINGYVIFYRDSIGYHDSDVNPSYVDFYYYFEPEINFEIINRYLVSNDTNRFTSVGMPWDGTTYINDKQRVVLYDDCLKNKKITYKMCREHGLFKIDDIPKVLIKSKMKFISIYKFRAEALTEFTAQNDINRYHGKAILVLPNANNEIIYQFSVLAP